MARLRGGTGFSLAELLIALIIVAIGVIGFASVVAISSSELLSGRRDTEAALIAAEQMEVLKAIGHDSVQSGTRTEGVYQLDWSIEGFDPKKVILVAARPGRNGGVRADTLISYIFR